MNLVFDLGAVVFDWRPAQLVRSRFAHMATDETSSNLLAHSIFGHADWQAFDGGHLTPEQVVDRTAARLGLERESLSELVARLPDVLKPIEGTVALLDRLRSARQDGADANLYYLSNMPVPMARELERRHEFLRWFDGGIFSGDVNCIKPQAGIFHLMAKRYSLLPQDTLFIDDSPANVRSGNAFGWQCILFESPAQLKGLLQTHPKAGTFLA
jgi:putative hydrolase of the HAD superfamily